MLRRPRRPPYKIKFYNSTTGHISQIAGTDRLSPSAFAGMTVSLGGKQMVFAQFDQNASGIMLAEIAR